MSAASKREIHPPMDEDLHALQNLRCRGILLFLPRSISKLCADMRNLVNAFMCSTFRILTM